MQENGQLDPHTFYPPFHGENSLLLLLLRYFKFALTDSARGQFTQQSLVFKPI